MRIVILDFDGPLHPVQAISGLVPRHASLADYTKQRNLFRWLPYLVDALEPHPDVGIAVVSNWRLYATNDEIRQVLGPLGARLMAVAPPEGGRYEAILEMVRRFGIEHYKVLDDAIDLYPKDMPELIPVDPTRGLSDPAVCQQLAGWLAETAEEQREPSSRRERELVMA